MNYGSEQNGANIYSTLFLYKTDYLKLKNLTIGYTLPELSERGRSESDRCGSS